MIVRIITIFPSFFASCLGEGLLGKAAERGVVEVQFDDLRGHANDAHHTVDDAPYGGGPGMVMKVDVWDRAIAAARQAAPGARVVLLTPQGDRFDDAAAVRLARESGLVLCCGRYEGVDERVAEHLVDECLSIGDYVLTGGEAAALVVLDAVARKLPGVVGRAESVETDTFTAGLKFPQYTRPPTYRGWDTPAALRSGDHARIAAWRQAEARRRTAHRRPDLAPLAAAKNVRLVLLERAMDEAIRDPQSAIAACATRAVDAYRLARLVVCVPDADTRQVLRNAHLYDVRIVASLAQLLARAKHETVIHLADQPGPGQLPLAEIKRIIAAAPAGITLTWGGVAPTGAHVAAPALPDLADHPLALAAWLDRLFGV
jgi:tRNA (guanine37-N1)-methyltransferase